MDIKDLRYVKAIIEQGSMSKAAEELYTTQSNVTQRIKKLESTLNVELFSRKTNGTVATQAAINLMPYLSTIEQTLIDARYSIKTSLNKNVIKLGILETIAASKLPQIIRNINEIAPDIIFNIFSESHSVIVDKLKNQEIDLAILIKDTTHPLIDSEVLTDEKLVIVTKNSNENFMDEIKDKNNVNIIVFRRGCHFRSTLEDFLLEKNNVDSITCHEFTSIEAIVSCVSLGLGISVLPISFVKKYLKEYNLSTHPLPNDISKQHIRLYYNKRRGKDFIHNDFFKSFK